MSSQKIVINTGKTPHLRIGLKWDPKESDYVKFLVGGGGDLATHLELNAASGISAVYRTATTLIRKLANKPDTMSKVDASPEHKDELQKMREQYLSDYKQPSYNLDLLCFTYDKNKKLVDLVSPYSIVPKNANKAQLAIQHSGDDEDGAGIGFDEEILIQLKDIAPSVNTMFIVVSSDNHGFGKIKGGLCSIISTQDEKELMKATFEQGGEQQTLVFAKLARAGNDDWSVEDVSDFLTVDADKVSPDDDTIDDILRNKYC